ncbi:hypothetical membrane protein [Corynebacterium kutscheri]|uniref:Hypothetical membrane protein n=1 Tax=Corynebacterium kutscheri TaxID=35755 RepID=A0A0F6TCY9_9CORY|nr:hypothetical protein [Corynebacterium kutscheri]AKE40486.1 hypothetical protein UL82_01270 [Corynebacterium kutscheri]VEH05107.1 hypothetical membrane protein [Corynebacterium kutscheri]VEH10881.1 hypothetical membrane protein [Corynebacterium kutscheri]VEH80642.1 hypothetical membrane protein [Corynebacterium kutscheri]
MVEQQLEKKTETSTTKLPEKLMFLWQVWMVFLILELVHQILNIAMSIGTMDEIKFALASNLKDSGYQDAGDNLIALAAWLSIGLAFAFSVVILIIAFFLGRRMRHGGMKAVTPRLFMLILSYYMIFRGLLVFVVEPTNSLHIAYYAVDGVLQLIIAVVSSVIVYVLSTKEILAWVYNEIEKKA